MSTMTMRAKTQVDMIGRSPEIAALREEIGRVARSDAKVLITGESGVGKEIVAQSIHTLALAPAGPSRPSIARAFLKHFSSPSCSVT